MIVDLDISDLRETERLLEDAIEAKGRLTATIAHELRNPLTAVVGFTSILTTDWGALEDDTRYEMVNQISQQLEDVSALLDDFLASSQESIHVGDAPVTLNDILGNVDLTGVTVEVDPRLVVRGDALRIRQIVRNLIRNASKYGGPHIRLRTEATRSGWLSRYSTTATGSPPKSWTGSLSHFLTAAPPVRSGWGCRSPEAWPG